MSQPHRSKYVDGLIGRAARARREGRREDAEREISQAVLLARREDAKASLASALEGKGRLERDAGRITEALALYREAADLDGELGDRLGRAHALRHLGEIHLEIGRADLAAPPLEEALAIYRAEEDSAGLDLANAVRALALLRTESGDEDEAARLWQEARTIYSAHDVDAGVSECDSRLARLRGR